jgi:hypothetical protein
LVEKVTRFYTELVEEDESSLSGAVRSEVDGRLDHMMVGEGRCVGEAVRHALGGLWTLTGLCSYGLGRNAGAVVAGGGRGLLPPTIARKKSMLCGLLESEGRVRMQACVLGGLGEAVRRRLCEVDLSCLVGEVSLPDCGFRGCAALRKVCWPKGLSEIGAECFEGCGLEEVDLGKTRTALIGERAFFDCERLSVVIFPLVLAALGSWCFSGGGPLGKERGCAMKVLDFSKARIAEIAEGL